MIKTVPLHIIHRALLSLLLVCLTSLGLRAQYNYDQTMRYGFMNISNRNYDLAQHFFRNAARSRPENPIPYMYMSVCKYELGDYQGAECDADSALRRNKYLLLGRLLRGVSRVNLNKDSLALQDMDFILEQDPYHQDAMRFRAVCLSKTGKHREAIDQITTLLRYIPDNADAYTIRAHSHLCLEDTTRALADIDTAIQLSPVQINAHIMRCDILINRKQWAEASQDMDEIIRQNPYDWRLYLNRAVVRYNYDNFQGAMKDLDEAIALRPDMPEAHFNRGLLKFEVKDLTGAAKDFSTVLTLQPDNFAALINRMQVYMESGKYRLALEDMQKITKRYPRFYPIYYMMAQCHLHLGNQQGYFACVRKADDMVRNYVDNPRKYRLDRPVISREEVHQSAEEDNGGELTEEQVIERYNRLVTAASSQDVKMDFSQSVEGGVQSADAPVMPERRFCVSPICDMQGRMGYFRTLEETNSTLRRHIPAKVAASPNEPVMLPYPHLYLTNLMQEGTLDDVDYKAASDTLALYIARDDAPELKIYSAALRCVAADYDDALAELEQTLSAMPDSPLALMLRAEIRVRKFEDSHPSLPDDEISQNAHAMEQREVYAQSIADLDRAIALDNTAAGAWYNKGCLYFDMGDLPSALNCFSYAIQLYPDFAPAHYNRALTYLRMGNSSDAMEDLSRAGALGILRAYTVLKKFR